MNDHVKFRRAGLSVAALAFVMYLSQWPGFAFPDQWSSALYSIMGLDPFRPLSKPLWQLVMAFLGQVTGASVLSAANLFSAVMGSLSVWLVFQLGVRIRRRPKIIRMEEDVRRFDQARLVSGLVAALFLAVSAPMIAVSTRLHPFSLDLGLLLAATLLTLLYRDHPRRGYWLGFAAIYGLGMAEFSTFILLGPVFFLWWAWLFWRSQSLRWPTLLSGAGFAFLGASIGLLFCYQYARSPVAEWREFDGFGVVVKYYLLDHYQQIRFSVPKHGWLIVLLTMVFPAGFIAWNGIEEADDLFTNIGLYFFRCVLVVVAVLILFNLPGSPWRVLGPSVTLVTPYAITALWFGQLIGFFYERLLRPSGNRLRPKKNVSPWPSRILMTLMLLIFAGAAAANIPKASPRQAEPLVELGRDVLAGMGEHTYLISNGMLDNVIQWDAVEQGRAVRLINRGRASSRAYMKFLTTWFDDPAMESMAEIGFQPFLDVWMSGDSNIVSSLFIQDVPDIWTAQGYQWIPASGKYVGYSVGPDRPSDEDQLLEASVDFARRHVDVLGAYSEKPALLRELFRAAGNQMSVFANNLGYHFASLGRGSEARSSYELALQYNPDNISAMINLADMARAEGREADAVDLKKRYDQILSNMATPLPLRQIVLMHGQVRNPAMFVQEGVALIRSGMTNTGVDRIREAMSLQPENPSIEFTLAQSLFDEGQIQASYEHFVQLSQHNPTETSVWLGLARCQLLLGKVNDAEQSFARLETMGLSAEQLAMERGFVSLKKGAYEEAADIFRKSLLSESFKGPSAVGLIVAAIQLNQRDLIGEAVPVLNSLPDYFSGQIMLYQLAMASGNPLAARENLRNALRIQPGNVDVLEKSIRLELFEGNEEAAKGLLDRLLVVDFNHSFGNYLLSGIHEKNGRLDLAEVALRRALPRDISGDAHYGLAWILESRDEDDEALVMIDGALKRQPGNPRFIGVKGIIKKKQNAWSEAEALLKSAIQLEDQAGRPVYLFKLHLASVYAQEDRNGEARQLVTEVAPNREKFLPEEEKIYQIVSGKLGID